MKKTWFIAALVVAVLLVAGLALPALAQVMPPEVIGELEPGASITVDKTVMTPTIPPKPDIYFLADTTGSMGPAIDNVKANAATILGTVLAAQPDAQFGVGAYQDFPVPDVAPFAYENQQAITDDTSLVTTAIDNWTLCFGGDGPEGWFYALDRIAADPEGIGWRDGSTRILVIFGDAPAHDPVPTAATGLGYDIIEATVTEALQAANIRVIAVNLLSGDYPAAGMDDDPNLLGGDYAAAYSIIEDGTAGQADRIATATGGVDLLTPTADQVSEKILEGLTNLPITVSWMVGPSDPGLEVTLEPASQTVTSGDPALFTETIMAKEDAPQCQHQYATVTFVDENGNVLGTESIDIHILDVTPPTVSSVEAANPAGKKVPPAGSTTLPGPKGGMNEDGFYLLTAEDICDPNPMIYVTDFDETVWFGPFSSGTVVKFTEDATVPPEQKKMGSTQGKAGHVSWHIILPTDAVVVAVDESGNYSWEVQYVPPLPK